MTRRRRLRPRLLWAGALLGLAVLLVTVSLLRVGMWTGQRIAFLKRPTREENAMLGRTSFAVVAALGALLLAAPASADSWGADENDQGVTMNMLDARERSFDVKQVATAAPDWFERFAAAHSLRDPVVDDRFRIDPTGTAVPRRRLERTGGRVAADRRGLAFGLLLGLGLVLAMRMADVRRPVAR